MQKDLTQGSVLRTIVVFAVPFLISYFLQTLYGLADLFIIGQFYGADSITAVSETYRFLDVHTCGIRGTNGVLFIYLLCRDPVYYGI